jgi:3-oxoacyl-[acyl-carrier-protein] synthase-3
MTKPRTGIKVRTGTNSRILGVGAYQPERVVPNSEVIEKIDSSDEWIRQRTGIETRRFAAEDESVLDMAEAACRQALEDFDGGDRHSHLGQHHLSISNT